jgi:hypothetical protein
VCIGFGPQQQPAPQQPAAQQFLAVPQQPAVQVLQPAAAQQQAVPQPPLPHLHATFSAAWQQQPLAAVMVPQPQPAPWPLMTTVTPPLRQPQPSATAAFPQPQPLATAALPQVQPLAVAVLQHAQPQEPSLQEQPAAVLVFPALAHLAQPAAQQVAPWQQVPSLQQLPSWQQAAALPDLAFLVLAAFLHSGQPPSAHVQSSPQHLAAVAQHFGQALHAVAGQATPVTHGVAVFSQGQALSQHLGPASAQQSFSWAAATAGPKARTNAHRVVHQQQLRVIRFRLLGFRLRSGHGAGP